MGPVARIQALVADHYQLPREVMTSPQFQKPLPEARWVAMYLAHTVLGKGPMEIGRRFNRNHATVLYGIRRVFECPDMLQTATELRERLAA